MNLVDIHCHLLPGIDDGPETMNESLALARACLTAGIARVVATPHVNLRHPNRSEDILHRRTSLVSRLDEEGVALRVESGAEIAADIVAAIDDEELRSLSLGGSGWLLIEPPTNASSFDIHQAAFEVQRRGFSVLIAHPERSPALRNDIDLVADLVASGVRTQITAEALTGQFGSSAKKCSRQLFERGLVHIVASDAHHATERPPGMVNRLKQSGHRDMVQWLCHDMPAWVLDGGDEPAPPSSSRQGAGPSLLARLRSKR